MSENNETRPHKTAKEKKFLVEYAKTLNATEAAYRAYDVGSRDSARKIGSEKLAKLDTDISSIFDQMGLDNVTLAWYVMKGVESDDLKIRYKYLELAIKLKSLFPAPKKAREDANDQRINSLHDLFSRFGEDDSVVDGDSS